MSWYYYLENKIRFPFQVKCIVAKLVSPLKKGETVEVRRLAPEDACSTECSCSSDGRAGTWLLLFPNWPPSIRTNPPPK